MNKIISIVFYCFGIDRLLYNAVLKIMFRGALCRGLCILLSELAVILQHVKLFQNAIVILETILECRYIEALAGVQLQTAFQTLVQNGSNSVFVFLIYRLRYNLHDNHFSWS